MENLEIAVMSLAVINSLTFCMVSILIGRLKDKDDYLMQKIDHIEKWIDIVNEYMKCASESSQSQTKINQNFLDYIALDIQRSKEISDDVKAFDEAMNRAEIAHTLENWDMLEKVAKV